MKVSWNIFKLPEASLDKHSTHFLCLLSSLNSTMTYTGKDWGLITSLSKLWGVLRNLCRTPKKHTLRLCKYYKAKLFSLINSNISELKFAFYSAQAIYIIYLFIHNVRALPYTMFSALVEACDAYIHNIKQVTLEDVYLARYNKLLCCLMSIVDYFKNILLKTK